MILFIVNTQKKRMDMKGLLRVVLLSICIVWGLGTNVFSQRLIQNQGFTTIPVSHGKAILMKEIKLNNKNIANGNYDRLKTWVKDNYTTDLVNSNIKYRHQDFTVYVKSKVDLLLPLLDVNHKGAKALMDYKMSAFIENGKCVVIFSDISYKIRNTSPTVDGKVKAEEFVTSEVLSRNDEYRAQRNEVQKGTLHYFNSLVKNLEDAINRPAPLHQ